MNAGTESEMKKKHDLGVIYLRDFQCKSDKVLKHLVVSCRHFIDAVAAKGTVIFRPVRTFVEEQA